MKKTLRITGLVFILIFSGIVLFQNNIVSQSAQKETVESVSYKAQESEYKQEISAEREKYLVDKVIDGDTVIIIRNGEKETVRFIGIDTPESVHPAKPVECFGIEASKYVRELLVGAWVYIESDEAQDIYDKYGRTLGYVWLGDRNINKELVEKGYAYEYTYRVPYKYQDEFNLAEGTYLRVSNLFINGRQGSRLNWLDEL